MVVALRTLAIGLTVFALLLASALLVFADDEPYVGQPIEEGSTSELGMVVRDTAGALTTPRDVLLWVDDAASTTRLYGPVAVTPAANMSVTLPPQANQITDSTKPIEEHRVTVLYRYPSGCVPVPTPGANCDVKVGEMRYLVRNRRVIVAGSTPQPSPAPTGTPTP